MFAFFDRLPGKLLDFKIRHPIKDAIAAHHNKILMIACRCQGIKAFSILNL
jgi:hypothetical protein